MTCDYGYFQQFDFRNETNSKSQVNFNRIFANIPQGILINTRLNMENADVSYQLQVIFNMSDVTKERNFKNIFRFYTFLQLNQRKVWVSNFDCLQQMTNYFQYLKKTFDHQNPNAIAGFISILSIGYKSGISFNITIQSITSTNVTIQVSNPKSLLDNLPPEYFSIVNIEFYFNQEFLFHQQWTSPQIKIVPNTFLMLLSADPLQYKLDIWFSDGFYTPNTHQQIQFLQTFNKTYLPLFCNQIEKVDPSSTQYTSVSMFILEINQQFTSTGTYKILLENTLPAVNFEITVNCLGTQQIYSSFYKFIGQTGKIQQTQHLHNCSSQYRILTYYSRFIQQMAAIEQLQIEITSNSLNVTQINIYNQYDISNQQLVAIQVI